MPDGPHLVLLPGMLCDAGLFAHQTRHLSEIADVTVGDLTRDDSVAGMAETVLDAAPERFALAGLSLGGIVAMEVMRREPERVERLALIDTSPLPPRPDQLETWEEFEEMTGNGRFMDVTTERLMPALIHPDRQDEAALTKTIERMAEDVGPEAFLRQLSAQRGRPDSRESLAGIECPTLVLCGREDALCPYPLHEEMAGTVPGADLVPVEGCGHLSSLEKPEAVTAVLRYWMKRG
jgi:pimeloyl-ACP methyl ester carboxylesterase